jgi:tight adherence protein B
MPILLILIFAVSLIFSFIVILVAIRPREAEKKLQSRLDTIQKVNLTLDNPTLASPAPGNVGFDLAAPAPKQKSLESQIGERLKRFQFTSGLETLIRHADAKTTVGSVVLTSVVLAVAAGTAAHLFAGPLPLTVIATIVGGAARYLSLRFQRASRLKKFNTALPDAIDLMSRALRAGHSMASSIEVVAEQSPQPLGAEFAVCFHQQKFGIPYRDALLQMGERVPSQDLHFLITAVLVQKETGGDLTDILDRTTHVIRERIRIAGEIRTYTAQGRLTGWILSLLPVILLALINIVTPGYSHILFYDPLGQKLLYAGGILILIGGFAIGRIVDIKV